MRSTREVRLSAGRLARCLRLGVALLACAAAPARAAQPAPLHLAVVPVQPPVVLHKTWSPLVERLSRDAGVPIELKLYERSDRFLEDAEAGVPDMIFATPDLYALARASQGYVPLVRSQRLLTGVIFVRRDSVVRSVSDLGGRTVAFVGPRNICTVVTRQAVLASGVPVQFRATYGGSTVNVVKSVLVGKADAGATLDAALALEGPETLGQIRTILETPPIASHPIAAHPRVAPEVRERIVAALLALAGSDEGRALLASARLASPIRADHARDYRAFDGLDYERLDAVGR